jgi:hypothetical protein
MFFLRGDTRYSGAAVVNLAHSASFHSTEKIAPSKPGIKHLVQGSTATLENIISISPQFCFLKKDGDELQPGEAIGPPVPQAIKRIRAASRRLGPLFE